MALLNSPVFARQPRVGRSVGLLVAGALWVAGGMPASAQATRAPEYSVKAAYLYNFTHFIEWPSNSFAAPDARIVIGVLGEDPFGEVLDQAVKGKTVCGRAFEVRRSQQLGELRGCQVLFVCASETRRLPEILETVKKTDQVTISDLDRFAEQGGVISFYMDNNRVRFKINLTAAERAGIKISSRLLRLGTIIRETGDPDK